MVYKIDEIEGIGPVYQTKLVRLASGPRTICASSAAMLGPASR